MPAFDCAAYVEQESGLCAKSARRALQPAITSKRSANANRLSVHELADAEDPKFAAVAGLFDPAKRQPGIGTHEVVDRTAACFQPRGHALAPLPVARENCRAESERTAIG